MIINRDYSLALGKADADAVQHGATPPSLTTLCEHFYVDRNVFGFTRDATELMKKNCLKFGYKYYRGKKIEGDAK